MAVHASPQMLEQARTGVPQANFRLGTRDTYRVASTSMDLVVCSLALVRQLLATFIALLKTR
jgi:trans-aconitate methyltransferase